MFLLNSFAACKAPLQNWSSGRVEVCVESKTELFLPVPFFLFPSSFLSFFFLNFQNRMLQLPGAVQNRWRLNHMPIDEGCGTQKYFKSRTVSSGAYFDQIQKMTRYGNTQDGEHNGSERRVKYGRIAKPQGATILLNQDFLYVCLAHLQAFLEVTMRTPVDVQVSQCIN